MSRLGLRSLVSVLVFQIAFSSAIPALAQTNHRTESSWDARSQAELRQMAAQGAADPRILTIERLASSLPSPELERNNPLLDQDPFFLRSQAWSAAGNAFSELESMPREDGSIEIRVPGASRSWTLRAPMHPVFATEELIFFAVNPGSDLFTRGGSLVEADHGEGLFVVSIGEILASSRESETVPVYFFPMPGSGWQASAQRDVTATEIPHHDLIVFQNTLGESLPVSREDIIKVLRVESMNLAFALQASIARAHERMSADTAAAREIGQKLIEVIQNLREPSRARTAFGQGELLFSRAFMAALGAREIMPARGSTAGFGMLFTGMNLDTTRSAGLLDAFWISSAYANDDAGPSSNTAITPQDRLMRSGTVLGLGLIGTIVLRYTYLKKEADRRAALYREQGLSVPNTRVMADLYAHTLTVLGLFGSIWPTNGIEYFLDRMGLAENNRIRKLFNETFGRMRATSSATPVNARTLIDGVGVIGVIDTVMVIVQYTWWNPPLANFVAKVLSPVLPQLQERMREAFATDNASNSSYNVIEYVRNAVAYLTTGAYSYAHDVQDNATNEATRQIREEMQAAGRNPFSPENEAEVTRRVQERVREKLNQQGLPQEDAFWYDANSIYRGAQALVGYAAPEGQDPSAFHGTRRQGLMSRAVEASLEAAVNELEATRSDEARSAIDVLARVKYRFSLLERFAVSPADFLSKDRLLEVAQAYRDVRRELVSLTFEGAPGAPLSSVPETWVAAGGEEGARRAAQIFRREFFGLMGRSEQVTTGDATSDMEHDPIVRAGRYERRQLRAAMSRANARFMTETHLTLEDLRGEGEETPQSLRWKEIYQEELLKQIGLYPDYSERELINRVEEDTQRKMNARLNDAPDSAELRAHLDRVGPLERARIEGTMRADFFAESYVEMTQNREMVPALSPAQPGVFQKIRQMSWVRNSRVLTMPLRFTEGLFSDSRYKRGLMAKVARGIPLADDLYNGTTRGLRRLPTAMTFGFLISSAVWMSAQPYSLVPLQAAIAGPSVAGMWATAMRIMAKMGWKPGTSRWKMAAYAMVGSCLTFTTPVWLQMVRPEYEQAIEWMEKDAPVLVESTARSVVERIEDIVDRVTDNGPNALAAPPAADVCESAMLPNEPRGSRSGAR